MTEVVAQDLEFIIDGSRRLDRLVEAILRLARMDQAAAKRSTISLGEVVESAVMSLQDTDEWKDVVISTDELPDVVGDKELLIQLFQNLIGNALKFTVEGSPKLHVTVEEEDGQTIYGLRDNGIGVAPEKAEEIFEPFRRLHAESKFAGSGIGLSICRKVVDRHGGQIWFDTPSAWTGHM